MAGRLMNRMMQAIRIQKFGGPEVMSLQTDVPIPKPVENQVLIRSKAAGVNPVDTYIRAGNYGVLPQLPYTPGKDGAGIVESVGSAITKFKKGDRVFNIFSSSGTYAQYYVAEEKYVSRLHDSVDYSKGAALGVPYATAYRALVTRSHVKAGQSVLIHGASGAVGLAGCQIARALGLSVIGTAGSEQGMQLVKENGAQLVFNHREAGYADKIMEATGGVDVILEMLADVNLAVDCTLCKYHGTIAVIGSRASLDFAPRLVMGKEISIHGVGLMTANKEDLEEMEAFLYNGQALGWLKPIVGRVLPLNSAAEAHRDVIEHSGGSQGKIILDIP